nr:immunoglobulin heavy chain junction region [Macaca mulatta]
CARDESNFLARFDVW